jgi:TatD DNase family protein
LAVTTTPLAFAENKRRAAGFNNVYVALGLHPQVVGTRYADINLFRRLIDVAPFVGEVGLDNSPRFSKTFVEQTQIFSDVLSTCASLGGRSVSIHSLHASKQTLTMIATCDPARKSQYALHWFTGSRSEALEAAERGCFFSVNQRMMASERLTEIVALIEPSQILTETDGPLLRGSQVTVEPGAVKPVVAKLASIWQLSESDAEALIASNFERFLNLG